MKKRYGIIGCGMMGQEHLRNINLIDDAVTYAVYEPNPNMQKMAEALAPEARCYASLDEILSDENIDCWLIVSPNHLHMDQLEQLARVPHKPVLVEKPLFTNINHLDNHWRKNLFTCKRRSNGFSFFNCFNGFYNRNLNY